MHRSTMFRRVLSLIAAAVLAIPVVAVTTTPVAAADPPSGVSFRLEGCRLPIGGNGLPIYTLPLNDVFICKDQVWTGANDDYTTGNLGKSWNELDLVPYRLIVDAGNSAPDSSTFTFAIVLDALDAGHPGYDVISAPTLNPGSSPSCGPVDSSGQITATPGLGGTGASIYRLLTLTIEKGATCVYDYYGRLALGSHLYPGASLHGNLALMGDDGLTTSGMGARDVSIPVKEITPQSLSKDMSATQGSDHIWDITKSATPAELNVDNTCATDAVLSLPVSVKVTWTKEAANPSGPITIITHVYATNPASRPIDVQVSDVMRSGTTVLDTATAGPTTVAADTTALVMTHTFSAPAGTTNLNDVATGTYKDTVTGIPIPGSTTATASATVSTTGPELNASATVNDTESITGAGLTFSADSTTGATGSFDNAYVVTTPTVGPVSWTSGTQTGSSSVTFAKTVYVAKGTIEADGKLSDTATLTGSNGFSAEAKASIAIHVNTRVTLTIDKTIPNVLQNAETASFTFDITDAGGDLVTSTSIDFAAGQTEKSKTISNLAPGKYTVTEETATGWAPQDPQTVTISAASCGATVNFANKFSPAFAQVTKKTSPAGFEAGWSFDLRDSGNNVLETVKTTGTGAVGFTTPLGEGSYSITETSQPGWTSDGGSTECTFTVNLPADAGRTFSCTLTNTYNPTVTLKKTGPTLDKIGDPASYSFTVTNTSKGGGDAGTPKLVCTVSDSDISMTDIKLAALGPGEYATVSPTDAITIPKDAADPFVNHASVSCTYVGGTSAVASATDNWSTNLFQPAVSVTKTGPAYAMVGDTVSYHVVITNTSSSDAPDLLVKSISDSLATVTPPASCSTLTTTGTCNFDYTYTIKAGDVVGGKVSNTITVHYNPKGFTNDVQSSASHDITILDPSFTLAKDCTTPYVAQGGTATFKVTITNTGNADLVVNPDEGASDTYAVAVGKFVTFDVTKTAGPGATSVDNTVTATADLAAKYGLSPRTVTTDPASDSCTVDGKAKIVKTVNGAAPAAGQVFEFQIRQNATVTSDGTTLEDKWTDAAGNITFSTNLIPGQTYQLCEIVMPGWNTSLGSVGTLFVPNSMSTPTLPNPNVNNMTVCANFSVTAGQTKTFTIDNATPPGGRALTIGFWKNWASCAKSNGSQKPVLDQTLSGAPIMTDGSGKPGIVVAATSGTFATFGPDYVLVIHGDAASPNQAPDCQTAVRLLNKSSVDGKGTKLASNPAFNLAAQLVGAEVNLAAGAYSNATVITTVNNSVLLLGKYGFTGTDSWAKATKIDAADAALMNTYAKTLDDYNNNR